MTPLFFCLVAVGSTACVAALVHLIDGRVNASIRDHVNAALEPTPDEVAFETHVTQALNVAAQLPMLPTQRRAADDFSDIR